VPEFSKPFLNFFLSLIAYSGFCIDYWKLSGSHHEINVSADSTIFPGASLG
jgi:hypothetical protein